MKKIVTAFCALFVFLSMQAQDCPGISVEPNSDEISSADTLVFTVVTKFLKVNVTYNWAISAGTIISGQGTARILVDTKEAAGMFITATVDLGGLPSNCTSAASYTVDVIPAAQLVVSGTFTNGQELKNAVQKFIAATSFKEAENTATAFIYLYKKPSTTESAYKIFKDAIISAFEYNKILPHQYKIADGGTKKLATYEMYLLNERAKEPGPSEQK